MGVEETRLAIAIPERDVFSESFIGSHIEGLTGDPTVIWGSPMPLFIGSEASVLAGVSRTAASVLGSVRRMSFERAHGAIGRRLPGRVYSRSVARFLRRAGVEVVLAEYGPTAVTILEACSISRTPLVAHFHGYDAYQKATLARLREPYQRLFNEAARVVAVSNHMIDQLLDLGCPAERLVCNPCGVDIGAFAGAQPKEVPPLLLALGRFVEKKGPMLTLLAFARVQIEEPRARLVMLGDGPLRDRCIALARELGIDNTVEFPGSVDHADVAAWMRRARCFVQHSVRAEDGDSEGTPVAVLEASSCGLPVVSTRHAGIVDAVVDGVGGFLVDEGDVDRMADYLLRMVREPELAADMGAAGRRHIAANYSSTRSLGNLRQVLVEASRGGFSKQDPY
jgi:glycosyltransferase involved in cell wall biosynthesis